MPPSTFGRSPSAKRAPTGSTQPHLVRWLFIGVWSLSILNALLYLNRGWLPQDVGSLGQPAMRVLLGQLPHRDFTDVYTGGLAFLYALTFRLLAPTAMAVRWTLLVFFAAWVPALWYVMRRLAGPVSAALGTLLAAAWTLPMYSEGMPSWYNLFFATFAVAALFRYVEVRRARWLVVAGTAAGVSIVFKVVGLYAVAAGLLALTYLEVTEAFPPTPDRSTRSDTGYRWTVVVATLALAAAVLVLVIRAMGPDLVFRFATAAVVPCAVLSWRMVTRRSGAVSSQRFRALASLLLPFAAGVAVVVALFVLPWVFTGSVGALFRGVFVLPLRRFTNASWGGAGGGWTGATLAAATVLAVGAGARLRRGIRLGVGTAAVVLLASALAMSGSLRVYLVLWRSLWWLPPWAALGAAWALFRGSAFNGGRISHDTRIDRYERSDRDGAVDRDGSIDRGGRADSDGEIRAFILMATFGMVSLVEVPLAAPIYFFYAAPLLLPMAFALVGGGRTGGRRVPVLTSRRRWLEGLMVFLLGFTVLRLNPGFIRHLGFTPAHDTQTALLRLPRSGGLYMSPEDRDLYRTVVPMVEALARGPYIYATPDSPEMYFLTGKRNPTPTLFEFLDPHPETLTTRVLAALDRDSVHVVVINRNPFFSGPVSPDLVAGLQSRFPMARTVGRFLVVWKPEPAPPAR